MERSPNENNIPSQRGLRRNSKLHDEITNNYRGRRLSRTASASTAQSVQYHTIEHYKSVSLSPKKINQETPEWKRRLLHGDVAYGERRDLFSPAGLENIFRPPPSEAISPVKLATCNSEEYSVSMPSSPPSYNIHTRSETQNSVGPSSNTGTQNRQEREGIKYKLNDENESDFSANDLSRGSSFQPGTKQQEEGGTHSSGNLNFGSSAAQKLLDAAGRAISGQSDIRNEELSPIYIARHNTTDGKIDYAALDLSAAELQERLESLQSESDHQLGANHADDTSQALPMEITTGTEDFAHNGRFVNLRRGGHSQEGSFQRRMLSPSSLRAIDESAMLPEESMQASTPKQLPNIRKTRASDEYSDVESPLDSPPVPRTPHPSPSKFNDGGNKTNSGSPLKLFGTYDTFTNQTLLRRLRSFEENFDGKEEGVSNSGKDMTHPELNDAFVAQSSPEKGTRRSGTRDRNSRKVNSFGEGDLDSFRFSKDTSYDSYPSNGDDNKEDISLPFLGPNKQTKFDFQLEASPALEEQSVRERHIKITSTISSLKQTVSVRKTVRPRLGSSDQDSGLPSYPDIDDLQTPRKRNGNSEGKRLPKSPLKYPTPKRRRTLREAEIVTTTVDNAEQSSIRDAHQQMQSVVGRKRKDARHDDDQQAANPIVLAMRQILRPRTPTPSQRSSQQREHAPFQEVELSSADRVRLLQEQKIAKVQAELDSTDALKTAALGMSQHMFDGSRKGSVTTQDFLDEAKKIMAGIRGKARPRSGLTSLEESESENDRNVSAGSGSQGDQLEESYQESTKEPFSRPPSREGGPLPRLPKTQQDPALLDHLRQYEEISDMEDLIASSMKSIAMAKSMANSAREIDRVTEETILRQSSQQFREGYEVQSDPLNIRIIENPEMQRKRKHSTSSEPRHGEEHQDFHSQGSNASSSESTARSIPTGSSRGSDSRRVIAPHTVSHLIPEQLAGMVFDRDRNIWIKRKTISRESGTTNFFPSDETDDDPFGDIPDLSVDETQELQRVKAVAARRKEEELSIKKLHGMQEREVMHDEDTVGMSRNSVPDEPESRSKGTKSSSFRSNSRLDYHQPTSDNKEPLILESTLVSTVKSSGVKATESARRSQQVETELVEVEEEIEKEISILEDRVDPQITRRCRNVTITFSSPLASIIEPSAYNDQSSGDCHAEDASPLTCEEDFGNSSVIITKRSTKNKTSSSKLHAAIRSTSRRVSVDGHKFSTRPVSRIDEQDEISMVENSNNNQHQNSSIVITTPAPPRRTSSMVLATPRHSHDIGTLELTPMSDFTVHQANESFGLNVSYVAGGQRYVSGDIAKRTLSLSIKDLIEKLTEVEPYEPFWGHIKQLDLKDKKLTNLHKLDEFCEKLEGLDVSYNMISQLNGASSSIRDLCITHNQLSDLTAWGHLSNLQYIDVSNNEITNLSAFKYLVHLRGLRADNNQIKSIDGIGNMGGLLSLRLRGNQIESLDFKGTKLQRLSDLDLSDNQICHLYNIHELPSLTNLIVEGNKLCCFATDSPKQLKTLRYLKMSSNNLTSIDVGILPDLRLLYSGPQSSL